MRPRTFTFALAALSMLLGCHVFRSLEDCTKDTDCARASRCDPGRFCTASGPLYVGASVPMSGGFATAGRDLVAAAKFVSAVVAQEHAALSNARASRLVRRGLTLELADDASDPLKAAANTQSFVDRNAIAVYGSLTSPMVLSMASVTFGAHTPQIAPYSGGAALGPSQPAQGDPAHPEGRYLFQGITTVAKGSAAAMALQIARDSCKRVVLVRSEDQGSYYDALSQSVPKASAKTATGKRCVDREIIVPVDPQRDYTATLDAMVEALGQGPGCIALTTPAPVAGAILTGWQARATKPSAHFFAYSILHSQAFLDASLAGDVQTALGAYVADLVVDTDDISFLKQWYGSVLGSDPEAPAADSLSNIFVFGVDSLFVLALAIEAAKDLSSPTSLRDAIFEVGRRADGDTDFSPRSLRVSSLGTALVTVARMAQSGGAHVNYDGLTGPMEFDERGVVGNRLGMWKVGANGFSEKPDVEFSQEEIDALFDPANTASCSP